MCFSVGKHHYCIFHIVTNTLPASAPRRTPTMVGGEAAFVPFASHHSLSTTSLFPSAKTSLSAPRSPCRCTRQRTLTPTASHAAETRNLFTEPKTTGSSELQSTGKFNFDSAHFRNCVSGEWFGYQVTFSAKTGAAQNIEVLDIPDPIAWLPSTNSFYMYN